LLGLHLYIKLSATVNGTVSSNAVGRVLLTFNDLLSDALQVYWCCCFCCFSVAQLQWGNGAAAAAFGTELQGRSAFGRRL